MRILGLFNSGGKRGKQDQPLHTKMFSLGSNSENKASPYTQNFMFSLFSLCSVLGEFGKKEQMLYVEFMFSLFIVSNDIYYVRNFNNKMVLGYIILSTRCYVQKTMNRLNIIAEATMGWDFQRF